METSEKFEQRLFPHLYRATVKDVKDPEQLGRVKCLVHNILGHEIQTDWAWPVFPLGGLEDYGAIAVPRVDSTVWVMFENGDANKPVYLGCWWGRPKGSNEVPMLARDKKMKKDYKDDPSQKEDPKGKDKAEKAWGRGEIKQPKPKSKMKYPECIVLKTQKERIVIEIDDTEGEGRLAAWMDKNQSWFEIDKDGELSVRVKARLYVQLSGNEERHVEGDQEEVIEGEAGRRVNKDEFIQVKGKQKVKVGGDRYTIVEGDDVLIVKGKRRVLVQGDDEETVSANKVIKAGAFARIADCISDDAASLKHNEGACVPAPTPPNME